MALNAADLHYILGGSCNMQNPFIQPDDFILQTPPPSDGLFPVTAIKSPPKLPL